MKLSRAGRVVMPATILAAFSLRLRKLAIRPDRGSSISGPVQQRRQGQTSSVR